MATPNISDITATIESVLLKHVTVSGGLSSGICNRHLPYVLDELRIAYGVEFTDTQAHNRTVNELAMMVQWSLTDRLHMRVAMIIEQVLINVDFRDLQYSASFEDHLCIDSIARLDIRDAIEVEFGITISEVELFKLRTIGGLENHIRDRVS